MKKYTFIAVIIALYLLVLNPIPSYVMSASNFKKQTYSFGNNLTIKLPPTTKTVENQFGDRKEVLFSYYFYDENYLFRGYIQLWQLNDLERFLAASRSNSTFEFTSYSLKPTAAANLDGYISEWTACHGDLLYISGREYWLRETNTTKVLRISFITDAKSFSEVQMRESDNIIRSILWKLP